MEAKVDVRKLQILNDRINQTIDALNQVRLSVHGLGHTGALQSQYSPFPSQGYGMQQPFGMGAPGLGFQPSMTGGYPGFIPPTPFGFQHSPFQQLTNPLFGQVYGQGMPSPWSQLGSPWGQGGSPWGQGGFGGIGGVGGGLSHLYGNPYGSGTGLYHSGPDFIERQLAEARANDPFRITQTFPFVVS